MNLSLENYILLFLSIFLYACQGEGHNDREGEEDSLELSQYYLDLGVAELDSDNPEGALFF